MVIYLQIGNFVKHTKNEMSDGFIKYKEEENTNQLLKIIDFILELNNF